MFLPTADGGNAITDAATQALALARMGYALAGEAPPFPEKTPRFHFELPGSVQGFRPEEGPETRGAAFVENAEGHSEGGARSLAIRYQGVAQGRPARVATATFIPPEAIRLGGYSLVACPTLYPGQTITARAEADARNAAPATVGLYVRYYGKDDRLVLRRGPSMVLPPGSAETLRWTLDEFGSAPIAEVGIEVSGEKRLDGTVYLDVLDWEGAPSVAFSQPETGGELWKRAWVRACNDLHIGGEFRVMQDEGEGFGLAIQGTREWRDYAASATITPRLIRQGGIAACVQGRKRWVGLLLAEGGKIRLTKALDGEKVLAEADFDWKLDQPYELSLTTQGGRYVGRVNGEVILEATDRDQPLESGAAAYVAEAGRLDCGPITVKPAPG
jgi:hypothetical protein